MKKFTIITVLLAITFGAFPQGNIVLNNTFIDSNLAPEIPPPLFNPPTNLTGYIDINDVTLTWDAPESCEWIQWDTGENSGNGIGTANGGTFYVASRWMPDDLVDFDGMCVSKMSFFPYDCDEAIFVLKIWTGPNAINEVMSLNVETFVSNEFNIISLDNPVTIDASMEYWFGYEVFSPFGCNPAGVDAGPAIQEMGDMVSFDAVNWEGMSAAYGLDYNWNLAVYVDNFKNGSPPKQITKSVSPVSNGSFVASGTTGDKYTFNPPSAKELTGYNVFRNDEVIGFSTETTYQDLDIEPGFYTYCVTAVYDDGESECSNTFTTGYYGNMPIFEDNFEAYNAGEQLACQNPEDWTTYTNAPCTELDAFITNEQAYSGSNSVLIEEFTDLVYDIQNYTSGAYSISFYIYIPEGFDGYFNILQVFGTNFEWGMEVYFNASGGVVNAGGISSASFIFPHDTWMFNEIYIDLDNDFAIYSIEGSEIVSWVWSTGANGQNNLNQLGGVNFYAGNNFYKYYLDYFNLEENVISTALPAPSNLTGPEVNTVGNPLELLWNAPGLDFTEWIHWDNSENDNNGIGLTTGGTFYVASHWNPWDIASYDGFSLTKMSFFPYNDPDAIYTLKIWTGENAGTEVLSQDISSFNVDIWNEINLDNPLTLNGFTEYWFGYTITHAEGTEPAGVDAGPAIQGSGDMVSLDGSEWASMSIEYGMDFNWNIQVYVASNGKGNPTSISNLPEPITNTKTKSDIPEANLTNSNKNVSALISNKELLFYNVYRNGEIIGNTYDTAYIDYLEQTGVFTYCVTAVYDEGESECSNEWIVYGLYTGIKKQMSANIQIFPNPASEIVNIKSDTKISNVKVYGFAGQIIMDKKADGKFFQINTTQFEAGIYFFRIETEEGLVSKRIIIK